MSDPEDGANTPQDVARLRDAPELFVVDDSLSVLFSSAAHSEQLAAPLVAALREAVERQRRNEVRFGIFEDRIVRVEPLVGSDSSRSYAVLLQRFSPDDMLAAARAHFGLSDLEARVLEVLLRGGDPASALAKKTTPDAVAAALSGLEKKTAGVPVQALLERLLDLG